MKLIILLLSLVSCAWATLPATGVINFRATATAGNVNGCGFSSARGGTDYTLQDAAQLTQTDGTASGTTTFTSALGGFTTAMEGNYLHITASTGLTAGWYEIVTRTDTNNVVLDRTPGTGTAATFYVGGACSLGSTLDDDIFEIGVPGNRFQIKNGSYTLGEAVSISAAGGASNPIIIEGYNLTPGDRPLGSTRPIISGGANALTLGTAWDIYYVSITGSATSVLTPGSGTKIVSCKVVNTSTTASRHAINFSSADGFLISSEAISYRGNATQAGNIAVTLIGNYLHDSNNGFLTSANTNGGIVLLNNIIAANVTSAISFTGAAAGINTISNNTLYGSVNNTGTGISLATGVTDLKVVGNIIYGFATGVSHADTQSIGYDNWNAYYNNTTDVTNWTKGPNDVSTSPGFVSAAQLTGTTATTSGSVLTQSGGDFSTVTDNVDFVYIVSGTGITAGKYLITSHTSTTITLDSAPGTNATADKVWQITTGHNFAIGTNYKALGYPGIFSGGLTTGYIDIGAVQRQESSSGSGGAFGYIK